jgi:hypothetical protein
MGHVNAQKPDDAALKTVDDRHQLPGWLSGGSADCTRMRMVFVYNRRDSISIREEPIHMQYIHS